MFNPITFSELSEYNDSNSLVMLGVIFNDLKNEISEVNNWFHEIGMIPETSNVTDLRHIAGNVRGEQGRSDYLICFDSCAVPPLIRLRYGNDIKWTSDFINNYVDDYN